jgi:hypothetical protein
MDSNGIDDSRKKRVSTDVVEGETTQSEEKTKKLRAAKQPPSVVSRDLVTARDSPPVLSAGLELDLEVSLQQLVRLSDYEDSKEYLSKTRWVQFRIGHAGDASLLASCFRKSKKTNNVSESKENSKNANTLASTQPEDTSLEVKLAEGLGDEDSPPSVFALLADIVEDKAGDRILGGAALLSSGWEDSTKVLRVEFFYVLDDDNYSDVADLLERRMWLRLSALAIMTSNQMIVGRGCAKKVPSVS